MKGNDGLLRDPARGNPPVAAMDAQQAWNNLARLMQAVPGSDSKS